MSGEKMPGLSEGAIVMLHLASRSTMSVLRIYLVPDAANGGVDTIGNGQTEFQTPRRNPGYGHSRVIRFFTCAPLQGLQDALRRAGRTWRVVDY